MSHYHFHIEKQVNSDLGTQKTVVCNYIVGRDYGDQEQRAAVAMGYAVKWSECRENLCFRESVAQ